MDDLEFLPQNEVSAEFEVNRSAGEYGADVIRRMLPHTIDGFKLIHRLIIWVLKDVQTKTSFNASLGQMMALHQSGDASLYDAIVRLGQDFKVGYPLVTIHGESGSYPLSRAAKSKYLGLSRSQFAHDLFFEKTHPATLPMIYSKNWQTTFPEYFVPRIPTSLLFYNTTVGYGYNSSSPQLNLTDVCDLVLRQCDYRLKKKGITLPHKDMAKYLLPDYPIENILRNPQELLEAYRQGNYDEPIYLDGTLTIKGNTVIVQYLNFTKDFNKTIRNVKELLHKRTSKNEFWLYPLLKTFPNNLSADEPHVRFEFKSNVNIFEHLNRFKRLLGITGVIHPKYNYVWKNKMQTHTPRTLLYVWYEERLRIIRSGMKIEHSSLVNRHFIASALLIVCDYMDKVIQIIRESKDEVMIPNLRAAFPTLSINQATAITKMPLGQLNKQSKERLMATVKKLDYDISVIRGQYNKLDEHIANDAQYMKKKYSKPRITKLGGYYAGCVHLDSQGVIQFRNQTELETIIKNNLSRKSVVIQQYTQSDRIAIYNNRILSVHGELPTEFAVESIVERTLSAETYTFFRNGNNVSFTAGIHTKIPKQYLVSPITGEETETENEVCVAEEPSDVSMRIVGPTFWAIRRNGTVYLSTVSEHSNRKTVSKGARSNLFEVVPKWAKNALVFHMDTSTPNELRIDRAVIDGKAGRCSFIVGGDTQILTICPFHMKELWIMLSPKCLNKIACDILFIRNIQKMFEDPKKKTEIIHLSKSGKGQYSTYIRRHKEIPRIMTLYLPEND